MRFSRGASIMRDGRGDLGAARFATRMKTLSNFCLVKELTSSRLHIFGSGGPSLLLRGWYSLSSVVA